MRYVFRASPRTSKSLVPSKWAFIRSLARSLIRLFSFACSLPRSPPALIFALSASLLTPSPPPTSSNFSAALRGHDIYADTLFVTRESRRGCLRQASRQGTTRLSAVAFLLHPSPPPVDQEIANVTGRLPCLDFSTAIFPFRVSFRRLFYLPAFPPAASTGREEQVHLNRLEDASLDGAATPKRLDEVFWRAPFLAQ